jgi:prophage tail gpP-like protein
MSNPVFSILINGRTYSDVWEYIDINLSMEAFTRSIAVRTADIFEERPDLWNIKRGDPYTAYINNEKIITGFIDRIGLSYRGDHQSISFTGRDKTADLIDCSWTAEVKQGNKVYVQNEWDRIYVLNLIKTYCKPYGITVEYDKALQKKVWTRLDQYSANVGEPPYKLIVKICQKYGIVPLSRGDGKLYLTKSATDKYAIDTLGANNVLTADLDTSDEERFNEYIVKGYWSGTKALVQIGGFLVSEGRFTDPRNDVRKERKLVIYSNSAADDTEAKQTAEWEAKIRNGKSAEVKYTLEGWTEVKTGKTWKINYLLPVNDKRFAIKEPMLIDNVNFNFDSASGYITKLGLVDRTTFDLEAKMKASKDRDKWR